MLCYIKKFKLIAKDVEAMHIHILFSKRELRKETFINRLIIFVFHNSLFSALEEHVILFSEFFNTDRKIYFGYDSFKKFHSLFH